MPKSADVSGSELAPFTAGNSKATLADQSARALGLQAIKAPPASDKISVAALRKLSSLQTGRFADPVNQRYPLDSLQDVVEANGWLDKYAAELPPRERRSMAQAICRRSEELGIPMGKVASAEGHTKLASLAAVRTQLEMRSTYYAPQPGFGKEAAKAFELLKVKVADLHPEVLVETIAGLDHKYGGDRVWGSWLADPWSCVFEKSADDTKDVTTYAYDAGNLHVSGTDIVRLAKHSPEVDRRYGKEFAEQFRADPIGFFDHLPMPEKEVLGHMAHEFDRSGVGLPVDRG